MHDAQEPGDQNFALPSGAMFLQQQVAEPLLKPVDEFQGRVFFQIGRQSDLLFRTEVMPVAAHQRQQTAILAAGAIDVASESADGGCRSHGGGRRRAARWESAAPPESASWWPDPCTPHAP